MNNAQEVVGAYFSAWNERDADRRRELLTQAWCDDPRYVDPGVDAVGRDAIDANLASVQEQFLDHRFELTSGVDLHHDRARFDWAIVDPDRQVIFAGVNYADFAGDGRLRCVAGFFGPVPESAP